MEVWIYVFIILVVIELCTVNLVSIWFIIGSLMSLITCYFTDNIGIQVGVFIISSTLSLLLTKNILRKFFNFDKERLNLDRIIGKIGVITEEIKSKSDIGEVKIDGKRWSCYASKKIKVGSKVEILSIDGVKLKVREVEDE